MLSITQKSLVGRRFIARNLGAEIVAKHYAVTEGLSCPAAIFQAADLSAHNHISFSDLSYVGEVRRPSGALQVKIMSRRCELARWCTMVAVFEVKKIIAG
jgi:hypothetical protein